MKDGIAIVGCAAVDHTQIVEHLPKRGELATICDYSDATGGIICNTGIDLRILDPHVPVYACGVIGNDSDGIIIEKNCKSMK